MTAPDEFMELADRFFGGKCEVTLRKVKRTGFAIHHVRYIDNDIERRMYPYTPKGAADYYGDLAPLVRDDPTRFALITNGIHGKLDNHRHGVCRLKPESRQRFCDLAMRSESRTKWGVMK